MPGHYGGSTLTDQLPKGNEFGGFQGFHVFFQYGEFQVGIHGRIPVSGKVLQAAENTPVGQATNHLARLSQDLIRVTPESTKANYRIIGVCVDIHHRGEIPVDSGIPAIFGNAEAYFIN